MDRETSVFHENWNCVGHGFEPRNLPHRDLDLEVGSWKPNRKAEGRSGKMGNLVLLSAFRGGPQRYSYRNE